MFFKKIKNSYLLILLTLLIIPCYAKAYSDYIIVGGENIGIELNSDGVIIVGTYEVNSINPAKDAGLLNGDRVIKINNQSVTSVEDMLNVIEEVKDKKEIEITYKRGNKEDSTHLKLVKSDNNVYKTGLYVKDSITGVGTLTYIDPNTKLFGALGHEIIEKNSGQKLEIKDGKIYSSTVTGVTRSSIGSPGEKNASYNSSEVFGKINENMPSGIFGNYIKELPNKKQYKVAKKEEVKNGNAQLLTVVDGSTIEAFDINIIKVTTSNTSNKNILFEVTDEKLLKLTGGIVQGMSGSPIIQNDTIIGAVTHVVVDDPKKGYGIFITKMLEEGEN